MNYSMVLSPKFTITKSLAPLHMSLLINPNAANLIQKLNAWCLLAIVLIAKFSVFGNIGQHKLLRVLMGFLIKKPITSRCYSNHLKIYLSSHQTYFQILSAMILLHPFSEWEFLSLFMNLVNKQNFISTPLPSLKTQFKETTLDN